MISYWTYKDPLFVLVVDGTDKQWWLFYSLQKWRANYFRFSYREQKGKGGHVDGSNQALQHYNFCIWNENLTSCTCKNPYSYKICFLKSYWPQTVFVTLFQCHSGINFENEDLPVCSVILLNGNILYGIASHEWDLLWELCKCTGCWKNVPSFAVHKFLTRCACKLVLEDFYFHWT